MAATARRSPAWWLAPRSAWPPVAVPRTWPLPGLPARLSAAWSRRLINAAVQDVFFVAITDVQISQKARSGITGQRDLQVDASQGIGGSETTTFSEVTNEKRYRTRVMSTANKVNLKYEEAAPELNAGLTRVLAGLF